MAEWKRGTDGDEGEGDKYPEIFPVMASDLLLVLPSNQTYPEARGQGGLADNPQRSASWEWCGEESGFKEANGKEPAL